MNLSYSWLKKYIDIDLSAEDTANLMTSIGLEVDSVETTQAIRGGLQGLVVGHVLTCEPHPDSDHMHITTVDIGASEPIQVVCGAANVAAGQKVIVATIGTVLYDGDKEFKIKASKLRGVPSNGMICAEDEIGVGSDHSGIIVLPNDTPVGMPAKEYYKLEDETMIVFDITPNRADAASHFGVARDLFTALAARFPNKKYTLTKPDVSAFKVDNHSLEIPVELASPEACTRYSGVTINNVTIKESPEWLKKAIHSIGLNPINNVVDVTNYILFGLGQPLHSFDAAKIKGGKVVVRTAEAGSKFVTLDGKERTLHQDDLMICNAEEPMCIAGVFGGLESGISESTTSVFLESACFNPVYVRKTARRQQLSTDASFRYERGTDPENTVFALKYAAMLIKEVAGGDISSDIIDIYPTPLAPFAVDFNLKRAQMLIGKQIPAETIKSILKNLEIEITAENGDDWKLSVPRYRVDVTREADVVEDILRIYGYDNVELPGKVDAELVVAPKPDRTHVINVVSNQLTARGFREIMCNTLTKASYYEGLHSFPASACVMLANPLSSDLNALRQTLLFGALESAQHNINRKASDLKFFEVGNCDSFNAQDPTVLDNYQEKARFALLLTGNTAEANWFTKAEPISFFNLKGEVYNIIRRLGINTQNVVEEPTAMDDIFAEGLALMMDKDKVLCQMGLISPKITKKFDIKQPVYFAEFDLNLLLLKSARQNKILFTELPKYPEVKRDLALLVDNAVTFKQIADLARRTEKKLLKRISLFDVYQGKGLPEGKKSYAVSFYIQDETKTLQDMQIELLMEKLFAQFKKELGAELR